MIIQTQTRRLGVILEEWEIEIPDDTSQEDIENRVQEIFWMKDEEDLNNIDGEWSSDDTPEVLNVKVKKLPITAKP